MAIILSCEWQVVINAIPCFCWGVLIVPFLYLGLKNMLLPYMKNKHELKIKELSYKHEKEWFYLKKMEEPLEKVIEECKKELDDYKN